MEGKECSGTFAYWPIGLHINNITNLQSFRVQISAKVVVNAVIYISVQHAGTLKYHNHCDMIKQNQS